MGNIPICDCPVVRLIPDAGTAIRHLPPQFHQENEMATTHDWGLWPTHQGGSDPPCSDNAGQTEECVEDGAGSCPDLAAICDAFDTDDLESLPEHGDFWQEVEEEQQ
jgi:hypothetical protein